MRAADGPADLAALLAEARARPGTLAYGSAGPGTPHHLGMELLASMGWVQLNHVPYRGSAAALTDLLGGRVRAMVVDLAPALPQIPGGRAAAAGRHHRAPTAGTAGRADHRGGRAAGLRDGRLARSWRHPARRPPLSHGLPGR